MVRCQHRKSKIKCQRAGAVDEDVYKYTHYARFLAITFNFTKNTQINTVPSSQSTLITPQISPLMIQDSYESSDKMNYGPIKTVVTGFTTKSFFSQQRIFKPHAKVRSSVILAFRYWKIQLEKQKSQQYPVVVDGEKRLQEPLRRLSCSLVVPSRIKKMGCILCVWFFILEKRCPPHGP